MKAFEKAFIQRYFGTVFLKQTVYILDKYTVYFMKTGYFYKLKVHFFLKIDKNVWLHNRQSILSGHYHEPAIDKFKMVLWHFWQESFRGHLMRWNISYDSALFRTYKLKHEIENKRRFEKMCLWVFILMTFSALARDSRFCEFGFF